MAVDTWTESTVLAKILSDEIDFTVELAIELIDPESSDPDLRGTPAIY